MRHPLGRSRSPGFTLIELLVGIAIIGLLLLLLLPALAEARRSGQAAVSASNLASGGRLQYQYAADHRDSFINPFDPLMARRWPNYSPAINWACAVTPKYSQRGGLDDNRGYVVWYDGTSSTRASESFAMAWGEFMMKLIDDRDGSSLDAIRAPGDVWIKERHQARLNDTTKDRELQAFDTSYYYPPVFWLAHERYRSSTFIPITSEERDGVRWWRRNRFSDVTYPAAKVMLFERFDFSTPTRTDQTGARVRLPPQWNNPAARPQVCTVDGAVSRVKTAELAQLAQSSDPRVKNVYQPSGAWELSIQTLQKWEVLDQPLETGQNLTKAWPQYFWATRNGIRGRDLPN